MRAASGEVGAEELPVAPGEGVVGGASLVVATLFGLPGVLQPDRLSLSTLVLDLAVPSLVAGLINAPAALCAKLGVVGKLLGLSHNDEGEKRDEAGDDA